MAELWHPTTAIGAIGMLLRNTLPSFGGISYEEFLKAAISLVETDLGVDLPHPLAKQSVLFAWEGAGQPRAYDAVCAAALHARIGTKEPKPQANPLDLDLDVSKTCEVYYRIKRLFPRSNMWPEWLGAWSFKAEKHLKQKEEAERKKAARFAKNEAEKKNASVSEAGGATKREEIVQGWSEEEILTCKVILNESTGKSESVKTGHVYVLKEESGKRKLRQQIDLMIESIPPQKLAKLQPQAVPEQATGGAVGSLGSDASPADVAAAAAAADTNAEAVGRELDFVEIQL